jgi:hypothetical protein
LVEGERTMIASSRSRGLLVKAALVVVVLVSTMTEAGTALGKPPVGGCPTPEWELRASPAPGETSGEQSNDQNGDGLSCYLEAPEGGGIFTIIDNVVRNR